MSRQQWITTKRGQVAHLVLVGSRFADAAHVESVCGLVIENVTAALAESTHRHCLKCELKHARQNPETGPPSVLEKGRMLRADGYVYCLTHTVVHDDTLDPYGEGTQACLIEANGTGVGVKVEDVHRTLFWGARKGDYPDA